MKSESSFPDRKSMQKLFAGAALPINQDRHEETRYG